MSELLLFAHPGMHLVLRERCWLKRQHVRAEPFEFDGAVIAGAIFRSTGDSVHQPVQCRVAACEEVTHDRVGLVSVEAKTLRRHFDDATGIGGQLDSRRLLHAIDNRPELRFRKRSVDHIPNLQPEGIVGGDLRLIFEEFEGITVVATAERAAEVCATKPVPAMSPFVQIRRQTIDSIDSEPAPILHECPAHFTLSLSGLVSGSYIISACGFGCRAVYCRSPIVMI
jgi:hypothetical protein